MSQLNTGYCISGLCDQDLSSFSIISFSRLFFILPPFLHCMNISVRVLIVFVCLYVFLLMFFLWHSYTYVYCCFFSRCHICVAEVEDWLCKITYGLVNSYLYCIGEVYWGSAIVMTTAVLILYIPTSQTFASFFCMHFLNVKLFSSFIDLHVLVSFYWSSFVHIYQIWSDLGLSVCNIVQVLVFS
jgi:hypothetical protein